MLDLRVVDSLIQIAHRHRSHAGVGDDFLPFQCGFLLQRFFNFRAERREILGNHLRVAKAQIERHVGAADGLPETRPARFGGGRH